jgi:hypothetical protein
MYRQNVMSKGWRLAPPDESGRGESCRHESGRRESSGSSRAGTNRRNKKFVIRLSPLQREELDRIVNSKTFSHRDHVRATAMLLADELNGGGARTDEQIALLTHLSVRTIETIRRRFVEQGLMSAISWRRPPGTNPPSA